jgi:hypothetical protein
LTVADITMEVNPSVFEEEKRRGEEQLAASLLEARHASVSRLLSVNAKHDAEYAAESVNARLKARQSFGVCQTIFEDSVAPGDCKTPNAKTKQQRELDAEDAYIRGWPWVCDLQALTKRPKAPKKVFVRRYL